jgi:hypothetical protein
MISTLLRQYEDWQQLDLGGMTEMAVAETLTEADLALSLTEVLERAYRGEQFHIERNGEVIATIIPPEGKTGITWGEFLATYHQRARPDDQFAQDLEAILAEREVLKDVPEWPD